MPFLTLGADMARPSRTGGKKSEAKARNASPSKGRKTTKTKRRIAPAAARAKRRPVSGSSKDLKEAREQQAATAEILKVIASSPDDVQPVLEAVAEHTMSLLDAWSVLVTRFDGELLHFGAARGALPDTEQFLRNQYPMRPEAAVFAGRCILERSAINISDARVDPSPQNRERARLRGFRAALSVPMLHNGQPIGVITVSRRVAGAFAANEVELLQTFADQAVIAIENARMFEQVQAKTHDLTESLQQQTATADVLKVISRSAFDLQVVLDTLVESAGKLCNATMTNIWLRDGDVLRAQAQIGMSEEFSEFLRTHPIARERGKFVGRAFLTGELVHLPDVLADPEYTFVEASQVGQFRSALGVPLIRQGRVEGVFALARPEPGGFTDREIELVRTFADQAVIAIENVRLFNETQEALERQTATADILKVIASSPSDVQPVFEAIAERSNRLVQGLSTTVQSLVDDTLHIMAFTRTSPEADAALQASFPRPLSRFPWGERIRRGEIVHIPDVEVELAEFPVLLEVARLRGFRSMLFVPLLREGTVIGIISVTHATPGRFADHHVQVLQTFADQAVIAIEQRAAVRRGAGRRWSGRPQPPTS